MISIIVPVYNVREYLETCIKSILSQTYTNFEVLLIDDGSTDGCEKICDEYALKDNRIKVFHKKNGGVSSARNLGMENMNGDFVLFIDSDDEIVANLLETVIKVANSEDTDIVIFGYKRISVSGEENNVYYSSYIKDKSYNVNLNLVGLVSSGILVSPINKFYRRTLIDRIRFREDIAYGEDAMFNIEVFKRVKKISSINECLYIYKQRSNSLVYSTDKSKIDSITESHFEYINLLTYRGLISEDSLSKIMQSYIWNVNYHIVLIIESNNISIEKKKEFVLYALKPRYLEILNRYSVGTFCKILQTQNFKIIYFYTKIIGKLTR